MTYDESVDLAAANLLAGLGGDGQAAKQTAEFFIAALQAKSPGDIVSLSEVRVVREAIVIRAAELFAVTVNNILEKLEETIPTLKITKH
jgi:hypothetical protein